MPQDFQRQREQEKARIADTWGIYTWEWVTGPFKTRDLVYTEIARRATEWECRAYLRRKRIHNASIYPPGQRPWNLRKAK